MTPIMFFTDDITINAHSATDKVMLGLSSIGDFIEYYGTSSVRVYEVGNELHIEVVGSNKFMTGPEL